MYKTVIDYDVKEEDKKIILDGLIASTKDVLGSEDFLEKSFSIMLKDENNNTYGGIVARFDLESMYVDLLWVDKNLRHQGYGTKLLNAAEREAYKLGCHYSTVDTYSFQAEEFYLKNGYTRLGEIKNLYLHHSKIFLRKKLEA
jgi:GNAT superfamily N-acetyltransferase